MHTTVLHTLNTAVVCVCMLHTDFTYRLNELFHMNKAKGTSKSARCWDGEQSMGRHTEQIHCEYDTWDTTSKWILLKSITMNKWWFSFNFTLQFIRRWIYSPLVHETTKRHYKWQWNMHAIQTYTHIFRKTFTSHWSWQLAMHLRWAFHLMLLWCWRIHSFIALLILQIHTTRTVEAHMEKGKMESIWKVSNDETDKSTSIMLPFKRKKWKTLNSSPVSPEPVLIIQKPNVSC